MPNRLSSTLEDELIRYVASKKTINAFFSEYFEDFNIFN